MNKIGPQILAAAIVLISALPVEAQSFTNYTGFIEKWEGRSAAPYPDPDGKGWVVGVGHYSLSKPSALAPAQIDNLLYADVAQALASARRLVKTFDQHPPEVKQILVDLCFNLGENGFSKFTNTIFFCNRLDYNKMGAALKDSDWYKQTGNRGKNHVDTLLKIK